MDDAPSWLDRLLGRGGDTSIQFPLPGLDGVVTIGRAPGVPVGLVLAGLLLLLLTRR